MSADAIKWARRQRTRGPADKAILLILAAESGKDSTARVPITRIETESDASRRAVFDALKRLRECGLVSWESGHGQDWSTYRLHH